MLLQLQQKIRIWYSSVNQMYSSMHIFVSVHPCDKADKGGCEHTCNKKGDEAECSCDDGYLLAQDGKSCEKSKLSTI